MKQPSCVFVIFGGNGDLSKRLLMPAFYNMAKAHLLPEHFAVLGTGRGKLSSDEYRHSVQQSLEEALKNKAGKSYDEKVTDELVQRFHYFSGDMGRVEEYDDFKKNLEIIRKNAGAPGSTIFYLATPPALFFKIPPLLKKAGLLEQNEKNWQRVVIEKPFGQDLASAERLNKILLDSMNEDQIYRIDHFLGKETVQNILSMRFGNGIFEPIWNRNHIRSVQITVAESLGVEKRAEYYDKAGALKDMIPNHLFQIVSLIGMEAPNSLQADDIRDEKVKLIKAITPFTEKTSRELAVRGQYTAGEISKKSTLGYLEEPGVAKNSTTETFAALKLTIDNWRWAGVPFYLQTGKRLPAKLSQVVIEFKSAPVHPLYSISPKNMLVLQIQPEEWITLCIAAKIPGTDVRLGQARLRFDYSKGFAVTPKTGYETLLYDVMKGDPTLFLRADQAEASWKVVQPLLDYWEENPRQGLENYHGGTDLWGPASAHALVERDGRKWLLLNSPIANEERKEAA